MQLLLFYRMAASFAYSIYYLIIGYQSKQSTAKPSPDVRDDEFTYQSATRLEQYGSTQLSASCSTSTCQSFAKAIDFYPYYTLVDASHHHAEIAYIQLFQWKPSERLGESTTDPSSSAASSVLRRQSHAYIYPFFLHSQRPRWHLRDRYSFASYQHSSSTPNQTQASTSKPRYLSGRHA